MNSSLPGAELVEQGLADLERGIESVEALLVSIGAPRLAGLGFEIPTLVPTLNAGGIRVFTIYHLPFAIRAGTSPRPG